MSETWRKCFDDLLDVGSTGWAWVEATLLMYKRKITSEHFRKARHRVTYKALSWTRRRARWSMESDRIRKLFSATCLCVRKEDSVAKV